MIRQTPNLRCGKGTGLVLSTLALALVLAGCGSGGSSSASSDGDDGGGNGGGGGGTVQPVAYKILATNDLGMHCVDADFSVFSILPPYNVVGAQVIRTDTAGRPSLAGDSAVALGYSPIPDANGSINSRSVGKTNFWVHAAQLFGANLAPGQGLKGLYMPADATSPDQTAFTWNNPGGLFKAEGIPIIPTDDAGNANRYPLMRIEATEKSSGQKVATLDIVLPVSEETTCSNCHATGSAAASGAGATWSVNSDLEVQSRENVLLLHDSRRGTDLMASRPVLCAACHYSAALDLAGTGPNGTQSSHGSMSEVMHAYHADKMRDATGAALPDQWLAQGQSPPSPETQACYQCHPGKNTQCLRGAMTDAVTCQNCHGDMSAVGAGANLRAGGSTDGTNDGKPRRPWVDLPRCQSCHTGDAVDHQSVADASLMATDGLRMLLAFRSDDPAASPIKATNLRFAENDNRLYRFSKGHGGVGCEGCHNSTHAIWPNAVDAANDNVAAEQLQGHSGTITECSTCHGAGTLPLSLGGPHGMHPVNDSRWTNGGHGDLAEDNQQACATCHGTSFRGTTLSRTAAQRTWRTEDRTRTVGKGQAVGCYDCHGGPGGEDG